MAEALGHAMSNVDRSKHATGYKAFGPWRPDGGTEDDEGSERRSFSSVVRLGAPHTTCILVDTSLPQVAADSCANYEVDAAALEETIVAFDCASRVQTVSEVNELYCDALCTAQCHAHALALLQACAGSHHSEQQQRPTPAPIGSCLAGLGSIPRSPSQLTGWDARLQVHAQMR